MLTHKQLFDLITNCYPSILNRKNNPPKNSFTIRKDKNGIDEAYVNIMSSSSIEGKVGTKIIFIDESNSICKSFTVIVDKSGNFSFIDSASLTSMRCAVMSLYAANKFVKLGRWSKVGIIGKGKMGLAIKEAAYEIFGVEHVVFKTRTDHVSVLDNCSAVFSCTNNMDLGSCIEIEQISNAGVFVSNDGGYILGQTFRKTLPSYSDYPLQTEINFRGEFPCDMDQPKFYDLADVKHAGPVAVYLYGVAISDVLVAAGCL